MTPHPLRADDGPHPVRRAVVASVIVMLIGLALAQLLVSSRPAAIAPHGGYRVVVSRHSPLGQSACRHELRVLGVRSGGTLCVGSAGRLWIHLSVKNVRDNNGYPVCTLTAYNQAGSALFDQAIFFPFGLPAGPELPRGTSLQMVWYLPQARHDPSYVQHQRWAPADITRYRATCHGRPESEVPV
jgi:hypothetical protein